VGRRDAGFSKDFGNFCVVEPHLDPGDNRLPVFGPEVLESGFVPVQHFLANCFFERRGTPGRLTSVERVGRTAPAAAADLVADSIQQHLPKIGLKGSLMARLEALDVADGLNQRFLREILRLERASRPGTEAAVRRSLQPWEVSAAEPPERVVVAVPRSKQQVKRGFRLGGDSEVAPLRGPAVRWLVRHVAGCGDMILALAGPAPDGGQGRRKAWKAQELGGGHPTESTLDPPRANGICCPGNVPVARWSDSSVLVGARPSTRARDAPELRRGAAYSWRHSSRILSAMAASTVGVASIHAGQDAWLSIQTGSLSSTSPIR
jgi:hypothetical protein